jgi:formylglycine-generating enzyme required for sulfatase activity
MIYCIIRGGGWLSLARGCRASIRLNYGPDSHGNGVGFRLIKKIKL